MNGFNFLESTPSSFRAKLSEFEFTGDARRALLGLLFVAALIAVATGIERLRLARAAGAADREEARLVQAGGSVRSLRASIETIERSSAVAGRVREIQSSGTRRARELAEVGARLPKHVWLTSLECSGGGATLKGGARDFEALAHAMARLAKARTLKAPMLVSSRLHDLGSGVDFELRLAERAR
jgi:Tfp pilus assembly protein PilN